MTDGWQDLLAEQVVGFFEERVGGQMTGIPEVTGRDRYIIAQALYEFIRLEQSKPLAERRGLSKTQRPSFTRDLTTN